MEILLQSLNQNLGELRSRNDYYRNLYYNQDLVLTESATSKKTDEDYLKLIKSRDDEIKNIDTLISKSQQFYYNILKQNDGIPKENKNNEAGAILSTAIRQILHEINTIMIHCIIEKKMEVDIKKILLIINEINSMIETLISSKKIMETTEEYERRSKKLDDLGLKVMKLLMPTTEAN